MFNALRSIWIWCATITLIVLWVPLLTFIRLFDNDPVRYRTGRWFRRLGVAMTKANPSWRLHISGMTISDPRKPFIVISNHQSHADIPLISHLPWEMKWLAKIELFKLPLIGWMLKLAGDIPVNRQDRRQGIIVLQTAANYLRQKCSVMFFPEGTRSPDGKVHRFNEGAFRLAIKEGVAVLPLVVEGSRDCLPKHGWQFGPPGDIKLRVLPPVETTGMDVKDTGKLCEDVRQLIIRQIAEWRNLEPDEVDGAATKNVGEMA